MSTKILQKNPPNAQIQTKKHFLLYRLAKPSKAHSLGACCAYLKDLPTG